MCAEHSPDGPDFGSSGNQQLPTQNVQSHWFRRAVPTSNASYTLGSTFNSSKLPAYQCLRRRKITLRACLQALQMAKGVFRFHV